MIIVTYACFQTIVRNKEFNNIHGVLFAKKLKFLLILLFLYVSAIATFFTRN